jgi:4-hydroxybenzoate polyprenyltransferase
MLKLALTFVRFKILITCYLIVLIGSLSNGAVSLPAGWAFIILVAWYINAASTNDYADREIDKINLKGAKNRPLLDSHIPRGSIITVQVTSALISIFISAIYGVSAIILTVIILGLNYAYSFWPFRIKDRAGLPQLILPLAYVAYPLSLGYWSTHSDQAYPWLLAGGLYLGFVARLFLKDFRDVIGDKKFGKNTFIIQYGNHATCFASWLFATLSLAVLSYVTDFSIGIVVIFLIGHIAVTRLLFKIAHTKKIKDQVELVLVIAKVANVSVVSLLAFFLSRAYLESSMADIILPFIVGISLLFFIMYKSNHHTYVHTS